MINQSRLDAIKRKTERFDFGKATEIAANMRFLLETIDELQKCKEAAISLVSQLEASSAEQESSDYRIIKGKSGVVCRKSTLAGLQAALR